MRKRTVRRQWALRNPLEIAIGRAARLPQHEVDIQCVPLKEAIDRLVTGRWERADWGAVRDAANRIEILMRMNKVDDPTFLLEVGTVINCAMQRFDAGGTKALRAGEAETLRWLHDSYMNVLGETTRGQFMDACTTAEREVARILAERRNKAKKEAIAC